jgi:hypothetical protein
MNRFKQSKQHKIGKARPIKHIINSIIQTGKFEECKCINENYTYNPLLCFQDDLLEDVYFTTKTN